MIFKFTIAVFVDR